MVQSGANSITRKLVHMNIHMNGARLVDPSCSRSAAASPSRPLAFGYDWLANGAANNRTRSTCTSAASSSSGRSCRRGGSDSVSRRWVRIISFIIVGHPYTEARLLLRARPVRH
jgi:hypothetical protein